MGAIFPPSPIGTVTQPLRLVGGISGGHSEGSCTWTLMAGRKASIQGKIFPRTSETGGWEKNVRKALPHWGANPTESSLHLWVTMALPEGPILYPLRETEVQSHRCACWLHLCSKKTHVSILAASVPKQHSSGGTLLPAALPAPTQLKSGAPSNHSHT